MKAIISTQVEIKARPEKVLQIFMDTDKFPDWNPFIQKLSGPVRVGEKIKVKLPGMSFKPVVMTLEKNKSFSWLVKLGIKGVFDGHHQFEFIDNGESTVFVHKEEFNGILVKWFMKNKSEEIKRGYEAMNEALKNEVMSTSHD